MVINKFRFMRGEIIYKIDKGASFCHVNRIRPDDNGMPWVTSGTQKWKGDRPSFIAKAIVIVADAIGLISFRIDQ